MTVYEMEKIAERIGTAIYEIQKLQEYSVVALSKVPNSSQKKEGEFEIYGYFKGMGHGFQKALDIIEKEIFPLSRRLIKKRNEMKKDKL